MRALRLSALLLLLMATISAPALARLKTDVILLHNGDRLTGEIRSLMGGVLNFKTDAMGTVVVEWKEIASIRSQYHYEFRLSDGRRHYGSVENSPGPGKILLEDAYGEHEVDWLNLVEIRPIEEKFKDRIDIYLSAGYSYTKASSVGQTSINTDISYEDRYTRNALSARLIITDTDEEITRSNKVDISRAVWTDRADYFRLTQATYEENDELALAYRVSAGGGLGKYFMDTNRMRWLGIAGLQILTEKSRGSAEQEGKTEESIEATLSTQFAAWRFDTPELDLKVNFALYPSLSISGRVRGDTDIRLRWEIIKDLFWDITAFGIYDSNTDTNSEFDYGITTGIGWEY